MARKKVIWSMPKGKAQALAIAKCAKGGYQRAILEGSARLSGSDLKGMAKRYGGKYARSVKSVLACVTRHNIPFHEAKGPHGLRYLVWGEWA